MKYSPWLLEDHTVYLEQKKKKHGQYDKENKINLRKTKKSISLSKSFDRLRRTNCDFNRKFWDGNQYKEKKDNTKEYYSEIV